MNKSEDLISVIVPVYNVEKYLGVCISSIINQTYKNLEIILVDDGSTDSSGQLCDAYMEKDNRIKVIHKNNGGLSSARNAGLDAMSGNYISFIDSDDYVSEKFIEKLHDLCVTYDADISECDFLRFENDVHKDENEVESVKLFKKSDRAKQIYMKHSIACNKMYKKYLFDDIRFPKGRINEDEYTIYKILYLCKNNSVSSTLKLYYYRYNPESIMNKKFSLKRLDVLGAFEERKVFYKENEENILYEKTVEEYQDILKWMYTSTYNYISKPKKYLKMIRKKMRCNLKEYINLHRIDKRKKIKVVVFSYMPNFYITLKKIIY